MSKKRRPKGNQSGGQFAPAPQPTDTSVDPSSLSLSNGENINGSSVTSYGVSGDQLSGCCYDHVQLREGRQGVCTPCRRAVDQPITVSRDNLDALAPDGMTDETALVKDTLVEWHQAMNLCKAMESKEQSSKISQAAHSHLAAAADSHNNAHSEWLETYQESTDCTHLQAEYTLERIQRVMERLLDQEVNGLPNRLPISY